MAKYEWSEVFMSIEGEARYAGWPTVYVRFARCNFQCRGFNNPSNDIQSDGYATLDFDPKDYAKLHAIPLIHRGCDSQYAVNPKFSHMWGQGDEKELAAEVLKVLPHNSFVNPVTKKRVILSLTGGEPTIRLKFWIPLLEELYAHGMRTILVETNCAAPMRDKDLLALYQWADEKEQRPQFIWSNSPKLSGSGETREDAIRPDIAVKQLRAFWPQGVVPDMAEQYFKFVCDPSETHFSEVEMAMKEYYTAGVDKDTDVYIMPTACTEEQQQDIAARVAQMCIDKGYIYCHRIQNSVFGNGVGT